MAEIYLTPIQNRTVARKGTLTDNQKDFIRKNASEMNINRMAANLGVTYHQVDSFVKANGLKVCKERKRHEPIDQNYEIGGMFIIDKYNPSTI